MKIIAVCVLAAGCVTAPQPRASTSELQTFVESDTGRSDECLAMVGKLALEGRLAHCAADWEFLNGLELIEAEAYRNARAEIDALHFSVETPSDQDLPLR